MSGAVAAATGGSKATVGVTLDTYSASASGSIGTLTTPTVSGFASGGVVPYTYVWTVYGEGTALSSSSSATQFRKTLAVSGMTYEGYAILTVTDANGLTGNSQPVSLYFERY